MAELTTGVLAKIRKDEVKEGAICLQVLQIEAFKNKHKCQLSDGVETMEGVTTTQVSQQVERGDIAGQTVLRVLEWTCNTVAGNTRMILSECEVLCPSDKAAILQPIKVSGTENATPNVVKAEPLGTAVKADPAGGAVKSEPFGSAVKAEPPSSAAGAGSPAQASTTPAPLPRQNSMLSPGVSRLAYGSSAATPGPAPSPYPPSEEARKTPLSVGSARKSVQPIQALNPYNNHWTIKARIARKGPKRSFQRGDTAPRSVFSVELIDEQGTAIEATAWDKEADKFYDALDEGKVYFFSKGKLRPANRNYVNVKNDYTITFDAGTAIEECADQDASKMQAKISYTPIDQLAAHIGSKVPVDVIGIVSHTGSLGSIKRKTDQAELARRDVTLVDSSLKTVTLTLWGQAAEEQGAALEAADAPVLSVSSCRVSDFNGVSLSTLQRSVLAMDPDCPEAAQLRAWYDEAGRGAATSAAGEGLANASRSGSGGASSNERVQLKSFARPASEIPPPDAKTEYATAVATIVSIDPDQNMYYMACPENNRKVVEQNGGYFCEYDGKTYPRMVRRYVLQVRAADESGECSLSVFNEQAETILGRTADELAELKSADERAFLDTLLRATWSTYVLRLGAKSREYNGNVDLRVNVQAVRQLNYAEECRRLADAITKYTR